MKKTMKKWIAVILALVLSMSLLTACGGNAESDQTDADTSAEKESAGNDADSASGDDLSIGVILTFTENGYGLTVKQYLDSIGEDLGIEFNYASAQETEEMNEALENYAAAGVDGIISMPTFNTVNEVEFCADHEIYYSICGSVLKDEIYEQVKDNPYYAGAIGNDDAASTEGMVQVLADKYDVKTLGVVSLPMGTSDMHDGRYEGVIKGAEENNVEIVSEGLAYNLTESSQNMVAQYPDLDAIIALAGGIEECMQPIISAGRQDTMKFAGFREESGAEELFETGALAVLGVGTPVNSIYAFINLYNAVTGNLPVPAEGEKCNYSLDTIYVSSADEYLTYVAGAMDQNPYTIDDIKTYLTAFNGECTFDDFAGFMDGYNLDYLAGK